MTARPTPKPSPSPELLRARGWIMPGSIYRRGNSYVLQLYVGKQNGQSRYKRITCKSYAEAQATQAQLGVHVRAHAAGLGVSGSPRERLGPYLLDWFDRARPRLASSTAERYTTFIAQIRRDPI